MSTELTVILTAHNRADLVEETLASLAEQVWDDGAWDVVLVDNDSTDHTPQILERWADKMPVPTRIVRATARRSPAHARNVGVAAATAPNVTFIDDDDLIADDWVAAMGTALRAHPLVASRHDHRCLNDETLAGYRGSFQTGEIGVVFGVPVASGGGLGCRRSLWNELGGQSESLGYGGEDIDFALRANLAGCPPVLAEDAVYHVRLRGGVRRTFIQGHRFARSRVRLYRAHGTDFGAHPDPVTTVVRRWAGLVRRLPLLRRPGPRLVWAFQLGGRVGHLQGSLLERTWYP